jgi:hypothetical protein
MSALLATALLAATDGLVTVDRMRTAALTPVEITKPIMALDCALADRQGKWHRVRMKVTGGRGYGEPWAGGTLTTHTPQRGEVVRDASRLFLGLPYLEDKYDALIFGRPEGPFVQMRSFGGPPQFSVVAVSQHQQRYKRAPDELSFAGHCDVRETAQQPLSEDETKEWLAR